MIDQTRVDLEEELTFLKKKFAYYTECQLATLDDVERRRSRTSNSERWRHAQVAKDMVDVCEAMTVGATSLPRLLERLKLKVTINERG